MKRVYAVRLTYDASEGRVQPGEAYLLEDDKAERWLNAGIATLEAPPTPPPPPPPPPQPEPEEEEEEPEAESADEQDVSELRLDAKALHDAGQSERQIAQRLGISRTRVHSLLAS